MSKKGMTPTRKKRAQKVVEMHENGASFEIIAEHLGVSKTLVREDYRKALEEAIPDTAPQVFHKVDNRLNKLHLVYWRAAKEGDIKAARLCLDINKQLTDLWGLQGAIKLDIEVSSGQEFADLVASIRGVQAGSDDGI